MKFNLMKKNNNLINESKEDIYTDIGHNIDSYIDDEKVYGSIGKREHLAEFFDIIKDVIANDTVKQMKNYRQHCNTSCYKHCMQVAYFTYITCKKLRLDYVSATRGAMLHDLFLYDWRKKYRDIDISGLHAFIHPRIALKNASKIFTLNDTEKDIIRNHMWPVTLKFPKTKEAFIVSCMDKYSATAETFMNCRNRITNSRIYRYAYVFLGLFIFRIF